ncbi:MAG: hypothetical protein K2H86_06015 [Muribaculaceae bacterium]|nr:hypothetical protein [Muribaculaceae bacterium]
MARTVRKKDFRNNLIFRAYVASEYPNQKMEGEFARRLCARFGIHRVMVCRWKSCATELSDVRARAIELMERRPIFQDPEMLYMAGLLPLEKALDQTL